jgi:hypothetical protein
LRYGEHYVAHLTESGRLDLAQVQRWLLHPEVAHPENYRYETPRPDINDSISSEGLALIISVRLSMTDLGKDALYACLLFTAVLVSGTIYLSAEGQLKWLSGVTMLLTFMYVGGVAELGNCIVWVWNNARGLAMPVARLR